MNCWNLSFNLSFKMYFNLRFLTPLSCKLSFLKKRSCFKRYNFENSQRMVCLRLLLVLPETTLLFKSEYFCIILPLYKYVLISFLFKKFRPLIVFHEKIKRLTQGYPVRRHCYTEQFETSCEEIPINSLIWIKILSIS